MKRKIGSVVLLIIIIISVISLVTFKEKEKLESVETNSNKLISMMFQNEEGNYIESTDINFPINEYVFNAEKSGCENGGTLSWNEEKQKIQASLLTSDKCYAYFDMVSLGKICMGKNLAECFIQNYKKDSSIIYHNGSIKSGEKIMDAEDESYRYSGPYDRVKNYVCLDSKTSGDCESNEDLYRIIGLFKNNSGQYEAKLIKAEGATTVQTGNNSTAPGGSYMADYDYLARTFMASQYDMRVSAYRGSNLQTVASYYWNSTNGTSAEVNNTNMWKESNLNKINLNGFYYNYITARVPNLINNIAYHTWEVGGITNINEETSLTGNAKEVYEYELGENKVKSTDWNCYIDKNETIPCDQENDLTYDAYIGLMYISDYMYGTSPNNWQTLSTLYSNEDVKNDNWMYVGLPEWSISRNAACGTGGRVTQFYGQTNDNVDVWSPFCVRPTFYLTTDVILAEGKGTKESPYRINF